MDSWRPTTSGTASSGTVSTGTAVSENGDGQSLGELPKILSPLAKHGVEDHAILLSNLKAMHCKMPSAGHEPTGGGFLVGKKCKHSEDPEVGGISVDKVAARKIGLSPPFDSLALGVDPGHRGDHGFSGTYLSHISWQSKTDPVTLEINPRQLYSRLFRNAAPRKPNWGADPASGRSLAEMDPVEASILDLVREDTRSLQRDLSFADQRRLEEYLEGLRSVERRLELANRDTHSHHQEAFDDDAKSPMLHDGESLETLPELVIPEGRGLPSVYGDHVNLMLDILTLAYQTDSTRVASFMFSYEKSGRSYKEIDAPASHHSSSHHQGEAEKHRQLENINRHHMDLFARMLARMANIQEGDSTLLENVIFLYGSGISDGNKHNHDDLPVLVAGGAGGCAQGGRHVKFEEATPICNVYLEMLAAVGVPMTQFGDSTGISSILNAS